MFIPHYKVQVQRCIFHSTDFYRKLLHTSSVALVVRTEPSHYKREIELLQNRARYELKRLMEAHTPITRQKKQRSRVSWDGCELLIDCQLGLWHGSAELLAVAKQAHSDS